jgi:AmmeMemoRadiSam system protein A
MGQVAGDRPLGEVVPRMAVAAGRDDPRFAPVTLDELAALHIEISVLSEPVRLVPVDPARLVIGRDGLIVRRGPAFGVLLPQVAPEHGWTADAFLAAACHKAGLAPDAWRDPDTEVLVFEADVFAEGLGTRV